MKKYCVVTYIFNNYELVREPWVVDENCDYYLFTDNKETTSQNWKVIYVEKLDTDSLSGIQKALMVKYSFYKYIPDIEQYEYFVAIDSSILIQSSLNPIIEYLDRGKFDLSVAIHPGRDNFTDEYNVWIDTRGLDRKYKDLFFNSIKLYNPNRKGLIETTVKVFKNCRNTLQFIDDVNNILLYSCNFEDKNDQCYFTYILSKYLDKLRINYHECQLYNNSEYMIRYLHGSDYYCCCDWYDFRGNKTIKFFDRLIRITDNNEYKLYL